MGVRYCCGRGPAARGVALHDLLRLSALPQAAARQGRVSRQEGQVSRLRRQVGVPASGSSLDAAPTSGKRPPAPAHDEARTLPPDGPVPEPPTLAPGSPLAGGGADSSGAETPGAARGRSPCPRS